jgi:hypothetical protein
MQTTLSRPVPVSRAAWVRAHDGLLEALRWAASAWQRLLASRRRAAEFEALRRLSPAVLRDIGAAPEWVSEAERWRGQQSLARDMFLRGL